MNNASTSYTDDPAEREVLSQMFTRLRGGSPPITDKFLEKIGATAKPPNANTPRKKVKEEVTYGTPLWLVKAIERDFDLKFVFDLAADESSCVTRENFTYDIPYKGTGEEFAAWVEKVKSMPPGHGRWVVHDGAKYKGYYDINDNSLAQDWNNLSGDLWLNPPFANIKAWAAKCETYNNGTICMLVPASLGSKWFRDHCMGRPVFVLDSRITFDGHTDPYPKDLMLVIFNNILGKCQKDFEVEGPATIFTMGSYSVKSSKQALQEIAALSEEYNLPD